MCSSDLVKIPAPQDFLDGQLEGRLATEIAIAVDVDTVRPAIAFGKLVHFRRAYDFASAAALAAATAARLVEFSPI